MTWGVPLCHSSIELFVAQQGHQGSWQLLEAFLSLCSMWIQIALKFS